MKKILVDDCVRAQKDLYPTYAKLIELLKQKLSLSGGEIMTVKEYDELDRPEDRNDVWKHLQVLCLHADSSCTSMVTEACKIGIPVIMFRGDSVEWRKWLNAFRFAGMDDLTVKDLESGRLFYLVDEFKDIRGAVRWIIDYYYPLRKNIANYITRLLEGADSAKQREAKQEILAYCLQG